MLTLNDGRDELWQWDTGRKLTVDADCSQVHFSNKVFGRSIDVDVADGVAIIPDILLQTEKDLNAWAFVGTSENGYTKISKTFKVNRRNKPSDYVFTPVEQTTIAEIAAIAKSVRDDADAGLFDGSQGPAGPIGPVGPQGEQGAQGEKGEKGDIGPQGPKGDKGDAGPQGEIGPQGKAGVDGKDGSPGADGHTPEYGVDYGTPEQIAEIAQQAANILQPEVDQLRSDLTGITTDDAAVDGKPWTSKRIIDTLCPPFSETGNPVHCHPVDGYPLGVNIRIAPIQEGSGDPSPENVRPITGTVAVQIVHSNDAGESNTYDIALPETVYGGTLDLQTGLLTVDRHIYTLTGDEVFVSNSDGSIRCSVEVVKLPANKYAEAIYSHYVTGTMFVGDGMLSVKYQGKLLLSFNKRLVSSMGYTVESLKAYLKTQYDGGTPVQACYCLDEPYEIQLTPQQITALSGVNTIYTDADGVIVTGAEDPKHTITELKNAILSLGGNI